jgi:hypothetical protein
MNCGSTLQLFNGTYSTICQWISARNMLCLSRTPFVAFGVRTFPLWLLIKCRPGHIVEKWLSWIAVCCTVAGWICSLEILCRLDELNCNFPPLCVECVPYESAVSAPSGQSYQLQKRWEMWEMEEGGKVVPIPAASGSIGGTRVDTHTRTEPFQRSL